MMRRLAMLPLLLIAPVTAQAEERAGAESEVRTIRVAPRTAYERCLRAERASEKPTPLELAMLRLKCGDGPGTGAPQRP